MDSITRRIAKFLLDNLKNDKGYCDEPEERLKFNQPQTQIKCSDPPDLKEIDDIIRNLRSRQTTGEYLIVKLWKESGN